MGWQEPWSAAILDEALFLACSVDEHTEHLRGHVADLKKGEGTFQEIFVEAAVS